MRFLLCLFVTVLLRSGPAHAAPLLQEGDRMVFLGDSITAQLWYTRFVMDYFALRYPGRKISFRNVSYSGETAPQGLARIERDVLSLKPTVVSIFYGMNDGRYTRFSATNYEAYMSGMRGIIAKLQQANVRVVLLTPGCSDPDQYAPLRDSDWDYNATLGKLAAGAKELAARGPLPIFDLYALMMNVQTKAKKDHPGYAMMPDGIHPEGAGHAVIAYALLKVLGCDEPAAGLAIDAEKGTMTPDRCTVADLQVTEKAIRFTRTDQALPTFFEGTVAEVAKYLPLMQELNQYRFTVTGLNAPSWTLTVEGINVGTFSKDELAAGVDLALLPGPWHALAKAADDMTVIQEREYYYSWYYSIISPVPEEGKAARSVFVQKMNEAVDLLEQARQQIAVGHAWEWALTAAP